MLDACAAEHERRLTRHHIRVTWKGRIYPRLPLGSHGSRGKRKRTMIEAGHVRAMVTYLGIEAACAEEHLPQLAGSFR